MDIRYCGVCHSDLHQAHNEWQNTLYPCLPGHEIVGRVTAVGAEVTKFKVGDLAGVGCLVDSCGDCPSCAEGLENCCEKGQTIKPLDTNVFGLIFKRRDFAGSRIGGIAETREMFDFCGRHGITADIEMIRMEEIETAFARMVRSDLKYRFVIDMATMPAAA